MVTRRALLIGAAGAAAATAGLGVAGVAAVDAGLLPGTSRVDRALGRCTVRLPPLGPTGPAVDGSFDSVHRRTRVNYRIAYPPGHAPGERLPVCLVLHGYGGDGPGAPGSGRAWAQLAGLGTPFVLAGMDGGPGYWHPHPTDDPLAALLDEFPAVLAGHGLATGRLAIAGWSMGGYGALLAATMRQFAGVVASSPAVWRHYAEAHKVNPGAFDSAQQWAQYDVIARADRLRGVRLRVDCGSSDPFAPGVRALRAALPDPSVVHLVKGCHDGAFWWHVARRQLEFLSDCLAG